MALGGANIFALNNRRTIRTVPNPIDKATIISVFPKPIKERKETTQPGVFEIAAGSEKEPSLLVVGPSSWWRDGGEDMPLIEVTNSSIQVAESIVKDYCNGFPEINENAGPGLFFVTGEHTVDEIKEKYSKALKAAIEKQKNWFNNLISMADKDWAQHNGNPRAISDLSKMAAKALNLVDRAWMKTVMQAQYIACVACGNQRNPQYPICPSCNRVVDAELAKKLGILELADKK